MEPICFVVGKVQPFGQTPRELTTYDLVSRGKNTSGTNQCYGAWIESQKKGWGPVFQNSCIHGGLIKTSGDMPTVWYNYVLASAGSIFDNNTTEQNPANNTTRATESVCPRGWTLPSDAEIGSISSSSGSAAYVSEFSPVLGGYYEYATLYNENTSGRWWGSEALNATNRRLMYYNGNGLYNAGNYRIRGFYIRCVQKST